MEPWSLGTLENDSLLDIMNHEIIYDKQQVLEFLTPFIPNKDEPELCISLMLFARRKYHTGLAKGEYVLNRTFIAGGTTPDTAVRKLWKLHVPVGCFIDSNDVVIPNNALCVYAVLKPKNMLKALSTTSKQCMDILTDGLKMNNPYKLFEINIGKSDSDIRTGNGKFVQIDLDTKDPDRLKSTCQVLEQSDARLHIISITETRGGYHIVYRKNKDINHKMLYEFKEQSKFRKQAHDGTQVSDYWFSQTNQPLVIVPGTYQGGFKAKWIPVREFFKCAELEN